MIEPEQLSRHIGEIYDAALDAELWPGVVGKTCALVGACAGALGFADVLVREANLTFAHGYEPHYLEAFATFDDNPATPVVLRTPVGTVNSLSRLIGAEVFWGSRMYREWAQPQGFIDSFGVNLDRSATSIVHLGFARHDCLGLVDEAALASLSLLYPHYRRAVLIGRLIDQANVAAANLADAFDGLEAAVFLVDQDRRLIHANAAGDELLTRGVAVRRPGDEIALGHLKAARSLRSSIDALVAGATLDEQGTAITFSALDGEPYTAHVLPLSSGVRRAPGRALGAVAAVFVRSLRQDRPPALKAMAQLYGLTPAEMRVLVGIVELGGAAAVAQANGVSHETVRTHLKHLFAKTGTRRQVELVGLMTGIVSPLR